MEECVKFTNERNELYNSIKGILQSKKLQCNTKILLGCYMIDKKKRDPIDNVLKEIFHHVNCYICRTKRFTNNDDIKDKKK